MGRECEYCDKRTQKGNRVETRGKAKYLGGVGTKVTGITRRTFKPNLQTIKVTTKNGAPRTVKVCTQCIRSGVVQKAVKQKPFKLPVSAQKAAAVKAPAGKTAAKTTAAKTGPKAPPAK